MSRISNNPSNTSDRRNEPAFSEYARKLIDYSREYQDGSPDASPSLCMSMATGRLIDEYGEERAHIANGALKEVAAKFVFG